MGVSLAGEFESRYWLEAGDRDTERRTQTVILVREAANTLLTLKQLISQYSFQ
mgnify:CR=1 FL=1